MPEPTRRFVTSGDAIVEQLPWGPHEWISRPDIVAAKHLLLVRVRMPAGQAHAFHRHPHMEEIVYVEQGMAEQWVDHDARMLGPGEAAHIPVNTVHGTYNAGPSTLVFLAILSPADAEGPALIDMSQEAPWNTLRRSRSGPDVEECASG